MAECEECGEEVTMPYECNLCGRSYCSEHRLPENHGCSGLDEYKRKLQDQGMVFDNLNLGGSSSSGIEGSLNSFIPTGFRGNVSYLFLAVMVVVFLLQQIVRAVAPQIYASIFLISSTHIEYVWTWVINIFSHGGLEHIFFNGIVLYFFGPLVERTIGSKRFFWLFMITGVVASVAQVLPAVFGPGIAAALGASGAIMGVMGTLTMLNPNLKVYLWFVIPMPLWILTGGYALVSVFMMQTGLSPGVGHIAHLSGLVLGVAYGIKLRNEGVSVRNQFRLSGGGGPGGPGGRF